MAAPDRPPTRHPRLRQGLRLAAAVLLLAAGGLLLQPHTARLAEREKGLGLQHEAPEIDREDALSQQLAFFTLGGLRSLAAEILVLDAVSAWMDRDWPRTEKRWRQITTLAPNRVNYWAGAAQDMGVNATGDVMCNPRLTQTQQATLAARYLESGLRFLQQGIDNNPGSILLHCRLGDLHSNLSRRPRFAEAAAAYHRAVELGAPPVYERQEFYNLCRIRGREKEAYALGRRLFESRANRVPSVACLLYELQETLDLPERERLDVGQLFGTPERALKVMRSYQNNQLRFPAKAVREYVRKHQN